MLCPRPPTHTHTYLETFLAVITDREACYWHLVGRGLGCCSTSSDAWDSAPTTKNDPAWSAKSREATLEKGDLRPTDTVTSSEKNSLLNKPKEELISSLLIQTVLKGHRPLGILSKTPNLSARIFKDHSFWLCGETAQESWSVFFFLLHSTIPPIISWMTIKMN